MDHHLRVTYEVPCYLDNEEVKRRLPRTCDLLTRRHDTNLDIEDEGKIMKKKKYKRGKMTHQFN